MGLKEALKKMLSKNGRLKEIQEEIRLQKMAEDRQKNSNERELETYYEEARQKRIKKELNHYRKKQQTTHWESNMMSREKNVFKGHKSVLENSKVKYLKPVKNKFKGGGFFK